MSRTDTFGRHGWIQMLTSVNFFENICKFEGKVYQCVEIHIWIKKKKKKMTVFCCNVQFLTYDLLKLSN